MSDELPPVSEIDIIKRFEMRARQHKHNAIFYCLLILFTSALLIILMITPVFAQGSTEQSGTIDVIRIGVNNNNQVFRANLDSGTIRLYFDTVTNKYRIDINGKIDSFPRLINNLRIGGNSDLNISIDSLFNISGYI